jgi:hypothetical protein
MDDQEIGVQFTIRADTFLYSTAPRPVSLLPNEYRQMSPQGQSGGGGVRETNHSPLHRAEAMNAWRYTSIFPIRLHGMVFNQAQRKLKDQLE